MNGRIVRFACLVCLYFASAGCGGGDYTGAERYPLSGKVTVDGEPIDVGTISFLPTAEGRPSGGPIVDGTFSVPESKGPNAGKHRVEISWTKKTGKQYFDRDAGQHFDERKEVLPARFHKDTELSVDVPSPDHTYNFDLKTK